MLQLMERKSGVPRERSNRNLVLCIDDELSVLLALRRLLRRESYELLTTQDPHAALAWAATRPISLVIADLRMPEMSGTDLLTAVHELSPQTRLVMLTAYPDVDVFSQCMRVGTRRLITKPWDERNLKWTIRELLRNPELDPDVGGQPT